MWLPPMKASTIRTLNSNITSSVISNFQTSDETPIHTNIDSMNQSCDLSKFPLKILDDSEISDEEIPWKSIYKTIKSSHVPEFSIPMKNSMSALKEKSDEVSR